MIRNILLIFFTAICFILQPSYAAESAKPAAQPRKQAVANVPMSTVLQNLKSKGYDIISKVDLDKEKEVYNIEAMSPQGKELAITMNAQSGEITSPKQNPLPHINLDEAVKRVEGAGYHDIYMVEYGSGKYIVRAQDPKNKKVKLKVDGTTGDIAKAWF